ncbi:MAG TPA: HAMP domain-containing histidine kinase [Candidatus Galloscillospira stercoripullorum]|nr:HAMP domain-containing histidine kinase [Candidatus Galloscillospira stercoripullorum]
MLIIVLGLCVIMSVFVAIRRRDALSLCFLGMTLSLVLMLSGVTVYIAKMGGVAAAERAFLYLIPGLQRWLRYLPVYMDVLGYITAVGRTLFPNFVMLAALEITMLRWVRRHVRLLRGLSFVPTALFLIYYYPAVFQSLMRGRLWLLPIAINISLGWVVIYLLLALALIFQEYRATTISFFKRNIRYVMLSVVSIAALYLLYATKDPAQIYNMFIDEYIRLGITTYISANLSSLGWVLLGLFTVFFLVLGSYGMVRYIQIDYNENREDLTLQRKFDAAGMGVSVFVHGIKNQLLSSRVLHKKLSRALEHDPPDLEQVRACAAQLRDLNEGMLGRMDELYRTVKNNALSLTPVGVDQVVASAVRRFHGKYREGAVRVDLGTSRLVLADLGALSEAIYNLLTNGYEAALQYHREDPRLEIVTRAERLWTVLEIRDNGGGITRENMGKIFDPFFTSKNTNYNWGMGLYYVRKIVKSHWGLLRLESQPGEGSTFYVMLPLFDAEQKGGEADG